MKGVEPETMLRGRARTVLGKSGTTPHRQSLQVGPCPCASASASPSGGPISLVRCAHGIGEGEQASGVSVRPSDMGKGWSPKENQGLLHEEGGRVARHY